MRSREVVEYARVDENGDQASGEAQETCDNTDDNEDHGDRSSPRSPRPETPRHDETQYTK